MTSFSARRVRLAALVLVALSGVPVQATEPNDEPAGASEVPLPPGSNSVEVMDSLDGTAGRINTLLGHFDPTYGTLYAQDDDGSPAGDGTASALFQRPVEGDGSFFVRVTGAGDSGFEGLHSLSGAYRIRFDVYDSGGGLLESTYCPDSFGGGAGDCLDSLEPTGMDNHWLNADPNRVGGHVDVVIDNLLGAGTGDALDFWRFTGLPAGLPFMAEIVASEFDSRLGLFDGEVEARPLGDSVAMLTSLSGTVPGSGELLVGVTGESDIDFLGEHAEAGNYTLRVVVVPEPTAWALASVAAASCGWMLLGALRRGPHRGVLRPG